MAKTSAEAPESKRTKGIPWRVFATLSAIAWLYSVAKVFVFDFDRAFFRRYLPHYEYLLDLRVILVLGAVAVLWTWLGNSRFLVFLVTLLFYPVWLFVWKLPAQLFKLNKGDWFFVFTYFNSVANAVWSLRRTVSALFLYGIGAALLLLSHSSVPVYIGATLILVVVIAHYVLRAVSVFKPLTFLGFDSKRLLDLFNHSALQKALSGSIESPASGKRKLSTKAKNDHRIAKMQNVVLIQRFFLFAGQHLQRFRDSKIYVAFFSTNVVGTFVFTAISGALVASGVDRVHADAYEVAGGGHFFDFFYYAFNAVYANHVSSVVPLSILARSIDLTLMFLGIVLLVLFLSTFWTARSERYQKDLDAAIGVVRQQADDLELRIRADFRVSVDEAEQILQKAESSMISVIAYFSTRGRDIGK